MLTNQKLIIKDYDLKTKKQVLVGISNLLKENKYITNKNALVEAFQNRENEFSTGIGDAIAIPHAEVEGIEESVVAVFRVKDIDWGSIDNKPVKTIVAIVVPKGGRGEHLSILANLSRMLMDEEVKEKLHKGSKREVSDLINSAKELDVEEVSVSDNADKYVIGITACPSGVAHTFLAQQSIIDEAKKRGFNYKIETQGSEGQKNALTTQDINDADAIIIATGVSLEGMERFNGYENKIHHVGLQPVIKNAAKAMDEALEVGENFNNQSGKQLSPSNSVSSSTMFAVEGEGKLKQFMNHLMAGLGAMIPLLIVAGIFMAIGSLGALPWYAGVADKGASAFDGDWVFGLGKWAANGAQNVWVQFCYYSAKFGGFLMGFMYPILAMYMARSMAGKQGTIPGFVAGLLAAGSFQTGVEQSIFTTGFLHYFYPSGQFVASSIFGAITMGWFAGWFVKYLNDNVQVSFNLLSVKTLLILPVVSSVVVFLMMMFIINPVFGLFNWGIQALFSATGDSGRAVYWWLMAASVASDLGGPINKAAGAVAISMNTDALTMYQEAISSGADSEVIRQVTEQIKTFNLTARNIAIVVPSIGLGTAAMVSNKVTGRNLFTKDEASVGSQSVFLALCGISEGAIPFLMKYPLYALVADISGAVVGVTVAMVLATPIQTFPMSEAWGWPLIGSTTIGGDFAPIWAQIITYIVSIVVGALVTSTVITLFLLRKDIREDKANPVAKISKLNSDNGSKELKDKTLNSIEYIKTIIEDEFKVNGISKTKKSKEFTFDIEQKLSLSKTKVNLDKAKSGISTHEFAIRQLNMELINNQATYNDLLKNNKDTTKIKSKLNNIENKITSHQEQLEVGKKNYAQFLSDELTRLDEYKKHIK